MRFVTFLRKNEQRLGLMGPHDQVIDLAELNRRYLRAGDGSVLASMQAFIDAGPRAVQFARKAEKYVAGKSPEDLRKLLAAGALIKASQARLAAPIPSPKKKRGDARCELP
jgi:hypothetical protein